MYNQTAMSVNSASDSPEKSSGRAMELNRQTHICLGLQISIKLQRCSLGAVGGWKAWWQSAKKKTYNKYKTLLFHQIKHKKNYSSTLPDCVSPRDSGNNQWNSSDNLLVTGLCTDCSIFTLHSESKPRFKCGVTMLSYKKIDKGFPIHV